MSTTSKSVPPSPPAGYERVAPIPNINNEELTVIDCVRPLGEPDKLVFLCEPSAPYRKACVHCGEFNFYAHGTAKDRMVHDCDIGCASVQLQVKVPRYLCNDCGRSFTYPFETIIPRHPFTRQLYARIQRDALNGSFSSIARKYEVTVPTVAAILKEYGDELLSSYHPTAPRVLGIDEKHIVRNQRGVLVDIENRKLIDLLPDKKRHTIIEAIQGLPYYECIEVVTMDMNAGYVSLIEEILPHATIVIDKFHVIQDLQRKVSTTRTAIRNHLLEAVKLIKDDADREYKRDLLTRMGKDSYLFKYGTSRLPENPNRIALMAELCETFPEVNTLRVLKEGLELIYDAKTRAEAETIYNAWQRLVPAKDPLFADLRTMKGTMQRWHKYIFNYFEPGCNYTNGITEALNSVIDFINAHGRGYGFEALRIKALFRTASSECGHSVRRKKVFGSFDSYSGGSTSMSMMFSRPGKERWMPFEIPVRYGADIDELLALLRSGDPLF